jgi:hypothetical protein
MTFFNALKTASVVDLHGCNAKAKAQRSRDTFTQPRVLVRALPPDIAVRSKVPAKYWW